MIVTTVRPAMLYGSKCWAIKNVHENKLNVAEIRILKWICGKTRKVEVRNEYIREAIGVAQIRTK